MIMKLGMEQYELKLYKVYISDGPELTLTNFNFAKLVFVLTVAPDIRRAFTGPLVLWLLYVIWSFMLHFVFYCYLFICKLQRIVYLGWGRES